MIGLPVVALSLTLLPTLLLYDMRFFLGDRIELVEGICRESLAQDRTLGDNPFVVVDERNPVNPTHRIDPEDGVYIVCLELLPELFPRMVRAHGAADGLPQPFEHSFLFELFFRSLVVFPQGLIAYVLAELARLERRADAVPVVGQGAVDDAGIVTSVDSSCAFLNGNNVSRCRL